MDNSTDSTAKEQAQAEADMAKLKEDLLKLKNDFTHLLSAGVSKITDCTSGRWQAACDKGSDYIRQHPLRSVVIAAAAGALISMICKSRR